MRLLLIALILIAQPSHALRGVVPGTECDRVLEIEKGLGSRLVRRHEGKPAALGSMLTFDGVTNGRETRILYKCKSGKADFQLINIKVASEVEGYTVFSEMRRDLISELGPPIEDLDEPSVAEFDERV